MAGRLDFIRDTAQKALANIESEGEAESRSTDSLSEDQEEMIYELKKNRLILLHMIHTRMIDNYLVYITSILEEVFRSRPEILRSSEKVEYSEVLGFQTIEDLVAHLAERKVHELSYKSVGDLQTFFLDRIGIKLVSDDKNDELNKAVATRNIIVHNRGIRNRIYCENVGEDTEKVGKVRDIGIVTARASG